MANVLAALTLAGIIERAGPRRATLRVSPRFLAHAEGTVGRHHTLGQLSTGVDVLADALRTWDEYRQDPHAGARFLHDVLADRDQLGALRPVFPMLESYAAA